MKHIDRLFHNNFTCCIPFSVIEHLTCSTYTPTFFQDKSRWIKTKFLFLKIELSLDKLLFSSLMLTNTYDATKTASPCVRHDRLNKIIIYYSGNWSNSNKILNCSKKISLSDLKSQGNDVLKPKLKNVSERVWKWIKII